MSTSNLFKQIGLQWLPDVDPVNAPPNALLRADNLVPDKIGALALRRGSAKLYSSLDGGGDDSVHSLRTVELANGTTYRVKGIGDKLFINGNSQGIFDGTGDISLGDDAYQIFCARGTTKKKFDGSNWYNWGITAPNAAPPLAAVSSVTPSVAGFDNSESPATPVVEGSATIGGAADAGGVANAATTLVPDGTTYRGVIQRLFTTDQNFYQISGVDGTETDMFDLYIKLENPRDVESVKIIFGADNSSTVPFTNDRFEFEFDLKSKKEIPIKDFESEGYSAYSTAVLNSLASVRPQDVTGLRTPEQVKAILASVGKIPSPTSAAPSDSNVWGHLTVTRGQFKRVGSTAARGWDTIRGFKVIYTTRRGAVPSITLADAIFIGGGARTLSGSYRCVIRAVREFDQYYELSPPSDQSDAINLNHQTLQVTIPGTVLSALDPQVDQLWVYLFGGWLDNYYRFAVVPSTVRGGMTIDELTTPAGSDLNSADERARIPSWGFTLNVDDGSSDLVLTLLTSEMDALTENEKLEPYQMVPPDNIVGIAGPWAGRMYVLTTEGYVYPSTKRSPGSFNSSQVIDLARFGDPLWIVRTGQGIYVGMEKDVVFLAGSGDDSADLAQIDHYGQGLNLGNPPIDSAHWVDGNSIIYRSADGLIQLEGSGLKVLPTSGTSLLWRGIDRHGVPGLNTSTGRFRMAIDDMMLYVLAPEGSGVTSTNVIYRFAAGSSQWSRLVYDQVGTFKSIFKEPGGNLIAGDAAGNLWQLDIGTQDNGNNIEVTLLTPITDGGEPLARKDTFDLQIHGHTAGATGTVNLYKDGSSSVTSTYTFSLNNIGVYRFNASDFGTFLKAQVEITGEFSNLTIQNFNLTYRIRPQHVMYLDTGYVLPTDPGDMVWLYEIELDAICADDVNYRIYINDSLKSEGTITVTTGIRKPYIVPVPRGTKGYRPRIVFYVDGDNAEGSVGFEPYAVRLRLSTTGNQNGMEHRKVYPVESAP